MLQDLDNSTNFSADLNSQNNITFSIYEHSSNKVKLKSKLIKRTEKDKLSYSSYLKENNLKKYSVLELKDFLKQEKIPVSGTKDILINKIQKYFLHIKSAEIIQKYIRRYIVELYFNLSTNNNHNYKGSKRIFLKRSKSSINYNINIKLKDCVNESDGFTLEPLNEINYHYIYKYTDKNGYSYAFDINSLYNVYQKTGKIENPYTREIFNYSTVYDILKLHRLIIILFPKNEYNPLPRVILNKINKNNYANNANNFELETLIVKLIELKNIPLERRINELFMEINNLGNYAMPEWFSSLNRNDYIKLYKLLYGYWSSRLRLNNETKKNICQIRDPFHNTITLFSINIKRDVDIEFFKKCCLIVMENWIYCGINIEYKKLAALHVLSILTEVSLPARTALFYLYESLNNII